MLTTQGFVIENPNLWFMPVNYFDKEIGVAGFTQENYQTDAHSHFSIEVAYAVSGSLSVCTPHQIFPDVSGIIIGSKVLHTFSCLNCACQLYFFDPTAAPGEYLSNRYRLKARKIVTVQKSDVEGLVEKSKLISVENHETGWHSRQRDERILKCVAWIEANYMDDGINLSRLAEELCLSESRLAHLFKDNIGISIRQYLLWIRIEMAAKKSLQGYSLTECAHSSGFTDSSHFTRTFKKMFGVNPSFALKG